METAPTRKSAEAVRFRSNASIRQKSRIAKPNYWALGGASSVGGAGAVAGAGAAVSAGAAIAAGALQEGAGAQQVGAGAQQLGAGAGAGAQQVGAGAGAQQLGAGSQHDLRTRTLRHLTRLGLQQETSCAQPPQAGATVAQPPQEPATAGSAAANSSVTATAATDRNARIMKIPSCLCSLHCVETTPQRLSLVGSQYPV